MPRKERKKKQENSFHRSRRGRSLSLSPLSDFFSSYVVLLPRLLPGPPPEGSSRGQSSPLGRRKERLSLRRRLRCYFLLAAAAFGSSRGPLGRRRRLRWGPLRRRQNRRRTPRRPWPRPPLPAVDVFLLLCVGRSETNGGRGWGCVFCLFVSSPMLQVKKNLSLPLSNSLSKSPCA